MKQQKQGSKKTSKFWLILSSVLNAFAALCTIGFSYVLKLIIDSANQGNRPELIQYSLLSISFLVAAFFLMWISITTQAKFMQGTIVNLRNQVLRSIFGMKPSKYREEEPSYYLNAITNDVRQLEDNYYREIPSIVFNLFLFIFAVAAMIYINPSTLIVFSLLFIIPIIIPQLLTKKITKKQEESSEWNEVVLQAAKENTSGYNTIIKNDFVEERMMDFEEKNIKQQKVYNKTIILKELAANISSMSGALSQMLCMLYAGSLVVANKITIGDMMVSVQLLNFVFQPINRFGRSIPTMRSLKTIKKKLFDIIGSTNGKKEGLVQVPNATISYEHVQFNFGEKQVVRDFSYDFKEGKKYLVTGVSGTGKSTLMKLLMRDFENHGGIIRVGGVSIDEIPHKQLYEIISEVNQEPFLFDLTIEENILLGNAYDEKTFEETIVACGIEDLVRENRQQSIGEFASRISGGEKQRIALARALYRKAKVVIFDEPTSALDPDKAKQIINTILGLKDITAIVISHDWSPEFIERFDGRVHLEPLQA